MRAAHASAAIGGREMTPAELTDRIDRWQRRRTWAAFGVAVGRKFGEDGAVRHGARIAYYAFFSIFPLLLCFVSILGFVLAGNPDLRDDIVNSTYAELPVIGPLIRSDVGTIGGSVPGLVIGVTVALWAGLGITLAIGQALDEIWGVPPLEQLGFVARRLRGLATIAVAGTAIAAGSVLGGAATNGHLHPAAAALAGVAVSLAVDGAALLCAFTLLGTVRPPLRGLLPGVLVAMAGLLLLQTLGGLYLDRTIARAQSTYGLFATVIGLLSWLSLAAQLLLISAEINAVAALRLWPRSLRGALTAADARAVERSAQAARRHPRETIAVAWTPPEAAPAEPRDEVGA
ncbi:MAG: YihY/virulence factor BrkB family protein [Solirubrobacteraceae bacterium]